MVFSPTVSQIHYLSQTFYNSSLKLSRRCKEIESISKSDITTEIISEHTACFFGSIFTSVSSLEAHINEVYFKISEYANSSLEIESIPKNKCRIIKDLWNQGVSRTAAYPILEKYQILLTLCEKEQFNKGLNPYQDVKSLVKLRNALVHYEPEMIELEHPHREVKIHTIESALKDKFSLNPFSDERDSFYQKKIISAGCSEWATKIVNDFVESFAVKMEVK